MPSKMSEVNQITTIFGERNDLVNCYDQFGYELQRNQIFIKILH